MGVESFLLDLIPPATRPLSLAELWALLTGLGFERLPLRRHYGPAVLAMPPPGETEFLCTTPQGYLEALAHWSLPEASTSRPDECPVTRLQIRFAIGQSPAIETVFWETVEALIQPGIFQPADPLALVDWPRYQRETQRELTEHRAHWLALAGPQWIARPMTAAESWAALKKIHNAS